VVRSEEMVLMFGTSGISSLSLRLDLVEKLRAGLVQQAAWQMSFFHMDYS